MQTDWSLWEKDRDIPRDARGRDGSGAAPSQGAALMASSQRKLQEERKGPQALSVALLTPGLWISSLQNVRQVFVGLCHPVCDTLYQKL